MIKKSKLYLTKRDTAFKDGGDIKLAPNGKPSNLTPEQYKLVRTPEFKEWFGDWENDPKNASKVVDENGEPLVLFNGSISNFTVFDREKIGFISYKRTNIPKTGGFFFTDKYNVAKSYVYRADQTFSDKIKRAIHGKVRSFFLNIRNIYAVSIGNKWDCLYVNSETKECFSTDDVSRSVYTLMDNDGVVFKNVIDTGNDKISLEESNIYVAFHSNQIKLADGSNVTFDEKNPDIRFNDGGEIRQLDTQLIEVEPIVKDILIKLNDKGYKPLIVGGAVRDAILGIEPKDIDIEVYKISYNDLMEFLSQYGKVDLVGKKFGVIVFNPFEGKMKYDFSVPRKENKIGVGHKGFDVSFDIDMTIKDGAIRRDFTFNALAYDPITNTIYDYFGGLDDIKNKIIRHTSNKFSEDYLRILRAMQFQSRFDFEIHPKTISLIRKMLEDKPDEYLNLSKERVYEEWMKWAEKGVRHDLLFKFMRDTGLIEFYPMLARLKETPQDVMWHPEGDVEIHTTLCLKYMDKVLEREGITGTEKVILVMSILLHDIGKPDTTEEKMKNGRMAITSNGHEALGGKMSVEFLSALGFHEDIIIPISNLVANHLAGVSISTIPSQSGKVKSTKKLSRRLAPATIQQLLFVMESDHNGRGSDVYKEPTGAVELAEIAKEINISDKPYEHILMGRHLIEAGLKPSPKFGEILRKASEAQENGEFSDNEGAKKWLSENIDKFNGGGELITSYYGFYDGNRLIGVAKAENQSLSDKILYLDSLHDKGYIVKPITEKEYNDYDEGDELTQEDVNSGNYYNIKDKKILYLHGLGASPKKDHVEILNIDNVTVTSPHLVYRQKPYFDYLSNIIEKENIQGIVGHSMGGYLAYYLSNKHKIPALMFNPAFGSKNNNLQPIPDYDKELPAYESQMAVVGSEDEDVPTENQLSFLNKTKAKIFIEKIDHDIPDDIKLKYFKDFINKIENKMKDGGDIAVCNKLYKDHHEAWDKLSAIEKDVCELTCDKYSKEIVEMWESDLKDHFIDEENNLFPSIRNDNNSKVIDELIYEHKQAISLIEEIKQSKDTLYILAFCELMKNHIKKEEVLMSEVTPDPYKNSGGILKKEYIKSGIVIISEWLPDFSLYRHAGIISIEDGEPYVYDNDPDNPVNNEGGNIHRSSLNEYLKTKKVLEFYDSGISSEEIKEKVKKYWSYKFDWFSFNCETFIEKVTGKKINRNILHPIETIALTTGLVGVGLLMKDGGDFNDMEIVEVRTNSGLTFDFDVNGYLNFSEVINVVKGKCEPDTYDYIIYKGEKHYSNKDIVNELPKTEQVMENITTYLGVYDKEGNMLITIKSENEDKNEINQRIEDFKAIGFEVKPLTKEQYDAYESDSSFIPMNKEELFGKEERKDGGDIKYDVKHYLIYKGDKPVFRAKIQATPEDNNKGITELMDMLDSIADEGYELKNVEESEYNKFSPNDFDKEEMQKFISKRNTYFKNGGGVGSDGKIVFRKNRLPRKEIYEYAKMVKEKYPKVWSKGGNIYGNTAFRNLKKVIERGYWLPSEEWMQLKWQSYIRRHIHDYRINGVVAMLKWLGTVEKGWRYMKSVIDAEIEKQYPSSYEKFKNGGSVCGTGMSVQTLIFDKDEYTKEEAERWAKKHDYITPYIDEKENTYRIRQKNPDEFKKDLFRTIEFKKGLKAVVACPK